MNARSLHATRYTSPQWIAFREGCLRRDGWRCKLCGIHNDDPKAHLQVHHRDYEHFGKYDHLEMKDCVTLCCTCHFYYEQRKKNNVKIIKYVEKPKYEPEPYIEPEPHDRLY